MADRDIERLRAEAAMQRQAIATDLELMGDRVSPARIAERRKAQFRNRIQGARDSVFGTSDKTRPSYQAYQQAYEPSYPPRESSGQWDQDSDSGQSLGDRASGALEAAKERTPDSLGEVTEGNPIAAGVIGFGVGLLAATLIPSSRDEQRAANKLQSHLDDAATGLGRTGREAVENVKPQAQEAVQDLTQSAKESVQAVKDDAQSSVESVKATAQDKAEEVRSQTTS
jgi:gas vesicle protein